MENRIIKLGVVGLKRGLHVVLTVINDENVRINAICDYDKEILKNASNLLIEQGTRGFAEFENFEEMLKSDIEAVFIATDATFHVPLVKKALEAGKHVLSEIPAVNSLEEAKLLKESVKKHPKLKYMTAENCCFWAFIETWKRMYEDGKFGEIVYAESEYLHSRDYMKINPPKNPYHWRTYNPAIKYLTHNLGPLLYIMNDKVVSVTCMESDIKYKSYRKGSENAVALFKTEKGTIIRILICFGAYVGIDHNFRLIGTRGTIETDPLKSLYESHSFARFSDIPGTTGDDGISEKFEIPVGLVFPGEDSSGHGGADKKMLQAFIKCIINDTNPPIDVDMGIQMSLPGIIAHESAIRGGRELKIPDIL